MTKHNEVLAQKIRDRDAVVGILGLGYVGLPLALAFCRHGFRVIGFDVDARKTEQLARAKSYIEHIPSEALEEAVGSSRFEPTADFRRLGEPDALLICVPTPLTAEREPDMRYVRQTAEQIKNTLRPGQLIVLESTTYPGTTEELLRTELEQSGLRCGVDFFLAFSPEREDPGNPDHETTTIPKVVGGVDEVSGDLAQALYDQVVVRTIRVSNARTAEATKLTENIFRAVNIALVNELKLVYERLGIDIWELLDAAETKPFGFMRFNPGPGWGGHCIPIDPFYLTWKSRQHGLTPRFIELAGEINVEMPAYVVGKLDEALQKAGKSLRNSRILLLGVAYKRDVGDPRESPAFEILAELLRLGAEVEYHDPHVPEVPKMRTWKDLPTMRSQPLSPEAVSSYDAILLVTDHAAVDYDLVQQHAQLVVDTRGVYREADPKIIKA